MSLWWSLKHDKGVWKYLLAMSGRVSGESKLISRSKLWKNWKRIKAGWLAIAGSNWYKMSLTLAASFLSRAILIKSSAFSSMAHPFFKKVIILLKIKIYLINIIK
jgi:hypothetical protein